jgi:hypothetical protein
LIDNVQNGWAGTVKNLRGDRHESPPAYSGGSDVGLSVIGCLGERADDYIRLKQAGALVVVKRQYASEQKGRWSEAYTLEPRATPLVT